MPRKTYLYSALIILVLVLIAAVVIGIVNNPLNQYVVKVNGEKVGLDEFKIYLKIIKKEIETQAQAQDPKIKSEDVWKTPIEGNDPIVYAKQNAVDSVVRFKLINQKAAALGIKLSADDEKLIQEKMKMPDVQQALQQYGIQEKDWEEKIAKESIMSQQLANYLTKNVTASNQEIDKFIASNSIDISKIYNVRQILFKTTDDNGVPYPADKQKQILAKANDVLKKIKAGEDIAKLAKEYSDDPGSKDNGGAYGFFMGQFVKEFQDATLKLKPGEVSGLVKSEYGYHIIKLESVAKPTQKELDNLRQQYKNTVLQQKQTDTFNNDVEKWTKEAKIEKNDALINSIKINEL